jgi:nucleotide-binding universal stress UspA family protein
MKKIIVPIDFSEPARNAVDFAIQFNRLIKGKILLLHVLELPAASVNFGADITASTAEVVYRKELLEGTSDKLHEWAEIVRQAGQEVAIRLEFGSPYVGLGKEVAEEGGDWVIIGSKGASGLKEVFLGSNAERIIRHALCPVITVKGKTNLADIKSMVFPTSLSPEQDPIMENVKDFQRLLDLNMHMVCVMTPYNFLTEKVTKDQLNEFAERMGLVDYTVGAIDAEFSEEGILEYAKEVKAGIIVMGTHGKTGLAHLFGGSRAEDVANHSKIPVVTFRINEKM